MRGLGPMLSPCNFAFFVTAVLLRTCCQLHYHEVKWKDISPLFLQGTVFWVMTCDPAFDLHIQSQMPWLDSEKWRGVDTPANTLPYHFEGIVHTLFTNWLFSIGKSVHLLIYVHTPNIWSTNVLWKQKQSDWRDAVRPTFADAFW